MKDGRKNNGGKKGNKGGNKGYGYVQSIKNNVEKYTPIWWENMGKLLKENDKWAMAEFNKLQLKMCPVIQEVEIDHKGGIEHTHGSNMDNFKEFKKLTDEYEEKVRIKLLEDINKDKDKE